MLCCIRFAVVVQGDFESVLRNPVNDRHCRGGGCAAHWPACLSVHDGSSLDHPATDPESDLPVAHSLNGINTLEVRKAQWHQPKRESQ